MTDDQQMPDASARGAARTRALEERQHEMPQGSASRVASTRALEEREQLDKYKDECGVFGIFGHPEAANLTYLGLYALQHRGQESAGIASADGAQVRVSKAMGYVNEAFDGGTLAKLSGRIAVGHVRYSTAGESRLS